MSIYRQHVTFVGSRHVYYVERILYLSHQQNHFYGVSLFSSSGPTYHYSSQFESVSGSDAADLENKPGHLRFPIRLK